MLINHSSSYLVLSECVDQSAIDVAYGNAEACNDDILADCRGEGIPLSPSYS